MDADNNGNGSGENNDFIIETKKERDIQTGRSFHRLVMLGIILSGLACFMLAPFCIMSVFRNDWTAAENNTAIVYNAMFTISICLCFACLITIRTGKRPFSRIMSFYIFLIGILYAGMSFVFWLIPGIKGHGYYLLSLGSDRFFIDGSYLTIGIILIIFSQILKYGFEYQHRFDLTI